MTLLPIGREAQPLLGADAIRACVARLGAEITAAHPDGAVLVASLPSSVVFLADLVRQVTAPVQVDFLAVSAYREGSSRVRILKDLDIDVAGCDVVLVEVVVDTGLSLAFMLQELAGRRPRSLEVCALLDKPARRVVPVPLRWVGVAIDEPHVVGYGMGPGAGTAARGYVVVPGARG